MTTVVLERETLPETLSSYFAVPRVVVTPRNGGGVILTPANEAYDKYASEYNPNRIDPEDYANDTEYLCALPGVTGRIMESVNNPDLEPEPLPLEYFNGES